jgi:hypothetical protein
VDLVLGFVGEKLVGDKIIGSPSGFNITFLIFFFFLSRRLHSFFITKIMASVSLTPRLKELIERTLSSSDSGEFDCGGKEQREALTTGIESGYVSNQSLKLLQSALVSFGEEGTLHEYLSGSKIVLPELVVKDKKVRGMDSKSSFVVLSPLIAPHSRAACPFAMHFSTLCSHCRFNTPRCSRNDATT